MKRLAFLALILFGFAASSFAQNAPFQNFCVQGGVSSVTQGLGSTNKLQGIIPSCTVTVFLTGTQTLAVIYSNAGGTPLANPFTAVPLGAVAPGMWTFWAAKSAAYDVVLSGGIPPNTYTQPVTLIGLNSGGGGGGASLLLAHNGTPLSDQSYLNFNDFNPSPPAGYTNVIFQPDGAGDLSGYVPAAGGVTQLTGGTCIGLSPSDGLGNVTVTYTCSSSSITPVQVVLTTTLITANTCTSPLTVSMPGVVAPSGSTPGTVFAVVPETLPSAVNGWGATGGLVMQVAATADTLNYDVCNQTGNDITPGALTVDVSAGNGGGGGSGSVTSFAAPSGGWPTWLTPTVNNPTTTPSLTVAAGPIPNSALANPSITLGSTSVALGQTITGAVGFNAATATALAGTPTQCSTGNAPTGIAPNGNANGCAPISGGGGGGGTPPILQVNSTNTLNQGLLNLTNTSTVTFTNPSGGVVNATVPTSAFGSLGVSSPDNTSINAVSGVYHIVSPGAGLILGFSSGNAYAGYGAGTNISLAGNLISNTSPANAVMTGLSANVIPVATSATTLGPSNITQKGGSTIIGSATSANVDGWGELAISGTTVTYTFANSYLTHPECVAEPQFSPAAWHWITYSGTASFTINFSSSVAGQVSYHCDART